MSSYKMIRVEQGEGVSLFNQKIAVSGYYPGHVLRIIGAQGNDVLFELYEVDDDANDHTWLLPLLDDLDDEFKNDQGYLTGIVIFEGKLDYAKDEDSEPELHGEWEVRRPTEEEMQELIDGTFTKDIL